MVICFAYLHSFQNYSIFRSFYQQRGMKRETVFFMWVMLTCRKLPLAASTPEAVKTLKNGDLSMKRWPVTCLMADFWRLQTRTNILLWLLSQNYTLKFRV